MECDLVAGPIERLPSSSRSARLPPKGLIEVEESADCERNSDLSERPFLSCRNLLVIA